MDWPCQDFNQGSTREQPRQHTDTQTNSSHPQVDWPCKDFNQGSTREQPIIHFITKMECFVTQN